MTPDEFNLNLQELLDDPAFVEWTTGNKPEDDDRWDRWAASRESGHQILSKARELVSDVHNSAILSDEYINHKIGNALSIAKEIETRNRRSVFPLILSGWNVAASLLIIAGLGFAVFRIYQNSRLQSRQSPIAGTEEQNVLREVINSERSFKYVQLPDGSSVVLHKNSSLKYPSHFSASKREVFLTGEAFFEVTKNPDQPFFVYAGELVAKVHGTSFSIKAMADGKRVLVAVKTGKVSVFKQTDTRANAYINERELAAMVLTSNQQATFERAHATLVRSTLNSPVLLNIPIENQEFTYSETPAAQVFDALAAAYGVSIDFNREAMADCSITATLGDEPLENKLKWLCTILEAEYVITNDKITIHGNPCR